MKTFRKTLLAASLAAGAVFATPAIAQQYTGTWSWDLLSDSTTSTPDPLGMRLTINQIDADSFTMSFTTNFATSATAMNTSLSSTGSGNWFNSDFLNGLAFKGVNSSLDVKSVKLNGSDWATGSVVGTRQGFCDNKSQCFYGGALDSSGFANITNNQASWTFAVELNKATSLATSGLHLKMDVRDDMNTALSVGSKNNSVLSQTFTTANAIPPVPEPETYAMMLAGLGVIGAVVRRRRQTQA